MKAVAMGQATPVQLQAFQDHIDEAQASNEAEIMESVRRTQETLQQPRPIVIDPNARWEFYEHSKILSLVRQGKGKAPFVIISKNITPSQQKQELLEKHGGKFIPIETVPSETAGPRFNWNTILHILATQENIQSIMIEGGRSIINSILSEPEYSAAVDSVIVTIAPTWLGQGGVVVSPQRRVDASGYPIPASRLTDVRWHPFGEDVVLLGRIIKP
jgi:2,5-diamino-6-(ribosylamino)-4(3H)-pyrimidinone 5'-phosphate reductase